MARVGWTQTIPLGDKAIHNACGDKYKADLQANHEKVCVAMAKMVVASPMPKIGRGVTMANEQPMVKGARTILVEIKDGQGVVIGTLLGSERTFSTGSEGFFASGKVGIKGSSQGYYQVSVNMVKIGSKPS